MSNLLAQMILARRSDDAEGWMNILFVVVVAAFWLVGGIVKAKAKKAENQDKEQLPRKPARKPPAPGRGAPQQLLKRRDRPVGPVQLREHRPGIQQPRTKLADLRAAARRFTAEVEQAARFQAIEPTPEPELSLPEQQIQPDLQELPQFTSKAVEQLEDEQVPARAKMAHAEYLSGLLSDYADPDELRRAILHYEILGRPLSLREPSERVIGL